MTTQTPPTIPADDFGLDGDRAWWIVDHPTCERHSSCKCGRFGLPHCTMSCEMERPSDLARVKALDRPCDTCDGAQRIQEDASDAHGRPCHDCIAGRHTWNIQVESELHRAWERSDHWYTHDCKRHCKRFRVSVVPGMVLRIRSASEQGDYIEGDMYVDDPGGIAWIEGEADDREIPPGARPGRFAVLLNVQRIAS